MPIVADFVPILLVLERAVISLQGFAFVVEVNQMVEICPHCHTELPHERLQWDLFHLSKLHFVLFVKDVVKTSSSSAILFSVWYCYITSSLP